MRGFTRGKPGCSPSYTVVCRDHVSQSFAPGMTVTPMPARGEARRARRVSVLKQALAILVGFLSGLTAYHVGMPLPWMLGAMLGTTVFAMAGLPLVAPATLRPIVIPIIGVLLGSSLSVEVLRTALPWIPSLMLLPVFLTVATVVCYQVYRRLGHYDTVTAFFSAVPGGLSEMIIFSAAFGGDERRVALAHGIRILFAVSFIGFAYGLVLGVTSNSGGGSWTGLTDISAIDFGWLALAAIAGGILSYFWRIPAGPVVLPMVMSSLLHIAGVVHVPPPSVLVIAAQIIIGTSVGARFTGVRFADIRRDLLLGLTTTLLMVMLAFGFAELVHLLTGNAQSQTFLAYSPGGLSEMSLIALAMGQEVAYVTVHHVARIVMVIFGAPLSFRFLPKQD